MSRILRTPEIKYRKPESQYRLYQGRGLILGCIETPYAMSGTEMRDAGRMRCAVLRWASLRNQMQCSCWLYQTCVGFQGVCLISGPVSDLCCQEETEIESTMAKIKELEIG